MRLMFTFKFLLILLVVVFAVGFLCGLHANAMPPYPGNDTIPQPVGLAKAAAVPLSIHADGVDQPSNFDMAGLLKGVAQPSALRKFFSFLPGISAVPPNVVQFHVLAICVDFSDKPHQTPAQYFDTLIYADKPTSERGFYAANSYGRVVIVTDILPSQVGWLRMPQPYSYYVNANHGFGAYPMNAQRMVEDALYKADSAGVDFSHYDNDGDGMVDGLLVTHAGVGAEFTGNMADIWSHKWNLAHTITLDGKSISAYATMPEYWRTPGDMTIGVYCHETGHLFGLPDLYDVDGSSSGIGMWSIMSSGSWNGSLGNTPARFDAWSRAKLGFATVVDVSGNSKDLKLLPSETSDTIYRVWAAGVPSRQYYLMENRQEGGLPFHGLAIWRCDDVQTWNSNEWYPGLTTPNHLLDALIQPDSLWQLEHHTNLGNPGDMYPLLSTMFSPNTNPSSNWYTGDTTWLTVTNVVRNRYPSNVGGLPVGLSEVDAIIRPPYYITCTVKTCHCPAQGDLNGDNKVDTADVRIERRIAFEGDSNVQDWSCQYSRADVNCDRVVDILDLVRERFYAKNWFPGKPIPCEACR